MPKSHAHARTFKIPTRQIKEYFQFRNSLALIGLSQKFLKHLSAAIRDESMLFCLRVLNEIFDYAQFDFFRLVARVNTIK